MHINYDIVLFVWVVVSGNDPSPRWGARTGPPDDARGWLGGESQDWCSPSREVLTGLTSEYTHGLLASEHYSYTITKSVKKQCGIRYGMCENSHPWVGNSLLYRGGRESTRMHVNCLLMKYITTL